jgi:CBS domain-containing protein
MKPDDTDTALCETLKQEGNPMGIQLNQNYTGCFLQPDAKRAMDVIKYGVITVTPKTRIYQALACIVDLNISGLPVVDDQMHLEGIITEKDLLILLYERQSTSGFVETYMKRDVVSFEASTPLEEICQCLQSHSFRRVPIILRDKVISVISRTDLLRVNLHKFVEPDETITAGPHSPFPAWQVMKKGLITVRPESPLSEAIASMADYSLSGLPVVDGDMHLVGMITEKDVMPYFYSRRIPPTKVRDLMTTEVMSFGPDDSMIGICECLIANQFRRVPIVKDGVLIGLVSRADVIRYILKNIARVSQFRAAQIVNQMIAQP